MGKLLFIATKAPHRRIHAQEGLDALLMGSAFSDCAGLFIGDGVYQLAIDQDPSALGLKNFAKSFGALADYGVTDLYACELSLGDRQLEPSMLRLEVEPAGAEKIQDLIRSSDKVLTF